ncbi:hypothetical protein TrLO_g12125 [Triparma laevis f. longispina]|uniref:Uncharacterized protein n=1 Tax=Triparma laevis f. longispina TaxID=1714387 RepID=A0A9W7E118_9STRA|nr:hypothetical protein TrLO_g12125 [Triparma laevis f. longispina]
MNRPKSPEHTSIHNDIAFKRLKTSLENEEKEDPTIEITAVAIKMKTSTTTSTITSTTLSATPPNTSDFLNTNDFTRLFIPFAHTDTLMKLRLTSKTWKTITDIHIDNGIQAGTSMVHDGTDTAYGAIDVFKRKLITQVFVHHNATKIGTHACMHVSNLLIVDIPEGVESISMGAFWGCIHLKQVSFPSTLKSIKYRSFRNCSELKTAYLLHTKLEELGSNAFFGCKDLQSMTIPPSLKKFGSNVFEECYGLVSCEMRSKTFDNNAVVAYLRSIQSAFPTDDFMHTNDFKRRLVAFVSDDTLMELRSTMKAWRVVAKEVFNEGVASGAMMVCD